MKRTLRLPLACALSSMLISGAAAPATAAVMTGAGQPGYVADEVIVEYAKGAGQAERRAAQRTAGTTTQEIFAPRTGVVGIEDGDSVGETIAELEKRPGVLRATPNWKARISSFPNDPGRLGTPGGWRDLQWNLLPETGVNAPEAWTNLIRAGRPGGRGVVVAVLDSGVAYRDFGRFRRSPDLSPYRIARGYDFVDRDPYPLDHNGHGTHVASTIMESAHNGIGVTGIAYGAKVMPVRVLDEYGVGDSAAISAGIRYAARRGAHVINLSLEFDRRVKSGDIPEIMQALRFARRKGAVVVAASGNTGTRAIAYPARAAQVFAVGATTEHGCQAVYSNRGQGLDIVAPGGGEDADIPEDPSRCRPLERRGRDIYQMTFMGSSVRRFGLPSGYSGTSMAAPHVSAVAALVIASRVLGRSPSPAAVERHLAATAVDLGPVGIDDRYGAGLVDAGAATRAR